MRILRPEFVGSRVVSFGLSFEIANGFPEQEAQATYMPAGPQLASAGVDVDDETESAANATV